AHNAIAPMWQLGAYIRSCELSGIVERSHSNVARKPKGWVEHKIHHAVGTREAQSQFRRHAQSPECWTRNFVSSGIVLRPPAGAGGKLSQRRDRVCRRHLQDMLSPPSGMTKTYRHPKWRQQNHFRRPARAM